ncbi:hypothetical protein [Aureliella helgolandensis]|uniref:Uncharacterized protein n=1 Tax=Aureliella helgolandensis TaxID=2527968 RepID=A0A518G0W0_9BACT|nr:hypothetical protein [Aureliella helgolandensis]QDV22233.1 hypothetical protein Q31a_05170 [Aureliella helgolandensis]
MPRNRRRENNKVSNAELLDAFWKRYSFHDMVIENVQRTGGRVIITLDEYVLLLTNATDYKGTFDEFPAVWIAGTLDSVGTRLKLSVKAEYGSLVVHFDDLRLVRRSDFAILIPPIDT